MQYTSVTMLIVHLYAAWFLFWGSIKFIQFMSTLLTVTVWRLVTDTFSHNNVQFNLYCREIHTTDKCLLFVHIYTHFLHWKSNSLRFKWGDEMTLHLLCWASAILHFYIEIFSNALDSIVDNNPILYHFRIQYPHVNYKPFFFPPLSLSRMHRPI